MNQSSSSRVDEYVPWIEKYRPVQFNNIVFDSLNKKIFENILKKKYFPNLLFYGPPGTGKTTTIINLINAYINNESSTILKESRSNNSEKMRRIIHLNASDERGIDIVRNQINQFVKTCGLFDTGLKFVILDEIDYMTKNAQQALKYLLQTTNYNVRFCLICNYISKVDESLKNEFLIIKFNQLPSDLICSFIQKICIIENMYIPNNIVQEIQKYYNSDIRSMINYIQLNQRIFNEEFSNKSTKEQLNSLEIISHLICKKIHELLIDINVSCDDIFFYIHDISIKHNNDKKSILQSYFNYMIYRRDVIVYDFDENEFLDIAEKVIRSNNTCYFVYYFIYSMRDLLLKIKH